MKVIAIAAALLFLSPGNAMAWCFDVGQRVVNGDGKQGVVTDVLWCDDDHGYLMLEEYEVSYDDGSVDIVGYSLAEPDLGDEPLKAR